MNATIYQNEWNHLSQCLRKNKWRPFPASQSCSLAKSKEYKVFAEEEWGWRHFNGYIKKYVSTPQLTRAGMMKPLGNTESAAPELSLVETSKSTIGAPPPLLFFFISSHILVRLAAWKRFDLTYLCKKNITTFQIYWVLFVRTSDISNFWRTHFRAFSS